MAHYDWLYETFTVKEMDEKIERTNNLINSLSDKKKQIELDMKNVEHGYTVDILDEKLKELAKDMEIYNKQLSKWIQLKTRTINGENYTWEQVHTIIKLL